MFITNTLKHIDKWNGLVYINLSILMSPNSIKCLSTFSLPRSRRLHRTSSFVLSQQLASWVCRQRLQHWHRTQPRSPPQCRLSRNLLPLRIVDSSVLHSAPQKILPVWVVQHETDHHCSITEELQEQCNVQADPAYQTIPESDSSLFHSSQFRLELAVWRIWHLGQAPVLVQWDRAVRWGWQLVPPAAGGRGNWRWKWLWRFSRQWLSVFEWMFFRKWKWRRQKLWEWQWVESFVVLWALS